ncbi:MAG TPA: TonB-dependent receptor [Allosphingosinicella sp.]|nr:TonB-dependent receptor [Allosphingosinicella sp.]
MSLNRMLAALLSAGSTVALAAPLHAQEAAPAAPDDQEVVVTAQRNNQTQVTRGGQVGVLGDQAAEDVPFQVRSYNEALILNQQPQTLGQVLENDPAVRMGYAYGNAAELFVIRGFPLFGDDISLNGLYGLTPRQLISPELYDRVQVLNGATAFLNGAAPGGSGIGGSVNLSSKRAGPRPLLRLTANWTSDSHFGGAFDFGRRFGEGDSFGVRINGAYRAGDVAIDDEFRRSAVLGGSLDYRSGPLSLSLDLAYQRVRVNMLRPKVFVGGLSVIPRVPAADANYAQPWSYTTLRDVFGMVRGSYEISDGVEIYAAFGARDGSEEGIYAGLTVTDPVTGAATGDGAFIPRTDNNESGQVGLRARFATGSVNHELNVGASVNWQVNRNAYDFFTGYATNLYNTPAVAQPGSAFFGGDLDNPFPIARNRLSSLYVSDTLSAFDDMVRLTLGLRHQNIRVRSYSYFGGAQSGEYDESRTTPVVGLVVKPAEGVSLYANRIEGLAQGPSAPVDPILVNPGEVFPPYKSVQYEFGGRISFGRINASLAFYQTRQPTALTRPVDPAVPAGPQIYTVDGRQRNRGVEFSVDGELARGLRLIAGGSINDAKLTRTPGGVNEGNEPVGVPDYYLNANLEWDLPFLPGATLTGRVVHTGSQQVNLANTLEIPSWTRVDLGARYVVPLSDRPLTLRFNVDNVAGERYWQSAYDSFLPALLQGQPRTFKLSASIDL